MPAAIQPLFLAASARGHERPGILDLSEYLAQYRDRGIVLMIAATGRPEEECVVCGDGTIFTVSRQMAIFFQEVTAQPLPPDPAVRCGRNVSN